MIKDESKFQSFASFFFWTVQSQKIIYQPLVDILMDGEKKN